MNSLWLTACSALLFAGCVAAQAPVPASEQEKAPYQNPADSFAALRRGSGQRA
jgi:PBP1b-binding outer membrane lipoprotein LpoB